MTRGAKNRVVDAWLRTPFQVPDEAPLVRASQTVLRIMTQGQPADVQLHRYVCRMENALYAPGSVGLLNARGDTVVTPHPLNVVVPPTAMGFGLRETVLPDQRVRLHHAVPTHAFEDAAICVHFSTGAAVFLRDVVLGAFRARRLLGREVPILVPQDLDERRRAFLKLAGFKDRDLVPVPADGVTKVRLALVPSRSFARDVRLKVDGRLHNLRFLMEPEDTLTFNGEIRRRYTRAGGRRLYLSRGDATTRRILNEDAVMKGLAARGFERLVLSSMTVHDLVTAFANAEIVISPHGSGLTNILFAPRGTRVIEIDHPRSDFVAHGLSRTLEQPFRILGKVPDGERDRASSISQTVDVEAMMACVDEEIATVTQAGTKTSLPSASRR